MNKKKAENQEINKSENYNSLRVLKIKRRMIYLAGLIVLVFLIPAIFFNGKPIETKEMNEFINNASIINSMIVTAHNENRVLDSIEREKIIVFQSNYGLKSKFIKRLNKKQENHRKIISGLQNMELYLDTSLDSTTHDSKVYFSEEYKTVSDAFIAVRPKISLMAITTQNNIEEHNEASIPISDNDEPKEEIQTDSDQEHPERLLAAKKRLSDTYPDSFSTQESLFESAVEDYYALLDLWKSLSEEEKNALLKANNRLEKTYYDSPSTHLSLLESEIESYRNLNN